MGGVALSQDAFLDLSQNPLKVFHLGIYLKKKPQKIHIGNLRSCFKGLAMLQLNFFLYSPRHPIQFLKKHQTNQTVSADVGMQ